MISKMLQFDAHIIDTTDRSEVSDTSDPSIPRNWAAWHNSSEVSSFDLYRLFDAKACKLHVSRDVVFDESLHSSVPQVQVDDPFLEEGEEVLQDNEVRHEAAKKEEVKRREWRSRYKSTIWCK